ncbi:hypothetical protein Enr17x_10880 [Gimesia fumaroli]|uniref:Uncharacterized protein n=1 Tax=Gimesia fumaroli TaxID=2527976 RepID=A0A518I7J7_9PLAN|nr:hypothetical protein Enr17x_10880 [Gimesia fumaroli]
MILSIFRGFPAKSRGNRLRERAASFELVLCKFVRLIVSCAWLKLREILMNRIYPFE